MARALVFLLETALFVVGVTMTLPAEAQPPQGGTLLGSAPALALPVRTLKLSEAPGLHCGRSGTATGP